MSVQAARPEVSVSHARADRDLAVVLDWLYEYVGRPHPALGRGGPVCPFVPPSLNAGAVRFHLRYGVTGEDPDALRALLREEMSAFLATTVRRRSGASLDSLLVVLPDTGPAGWAAIDTAYTSLKDDAVRQGLMIGQFHPDCDERAVRNPAFPVSRAPVGLLVVRHMAPHDILFLHARGDWFAAYHGRFAAEFARGKVRDQLMRDLYAGAVARFARTEPTLP